MKELSIEEKAKAYDEAIERAKDMLSYKEVRREDMEYLFPELCEKHQTSAEHWKPSNEQITWLYRAADDASKDSRMKQVLNELLSDLKKLSEK